VGRLLDRDDGVAIGEVDEVRRRQVDVIGHAVVVDHDRQVVGARQAAEVRHGFPGILLVDHAGQSHKPRATGLLGALGEGDGEIGGIFGVTGEDGNAAPKTVAGQELSLPVLYFI